MLASALQPSQDENWLREERRGAQACSHLQLQSGKLKWIKQKNLQQHPGNQKRGRGLILTSVDWGALTVGTGASLRWEPGQHWAIYIEQSDTQHMGALGLRTVVSRFSL